jgi:hypothetical protein
MSNEFELIFDASNTRESLGLPAQPVGQDVILKMDRPLWAYEPAHNSTLANAIEHDDFANLIAGPSSTPEYAFGPESAELLAFRKIRPIPKAALAPGHEMADLQAKLSKLTRTLAHRDASPHRAALKTIINEFRYSPVFAAVRADDAWDALLNHATEFVAGVVRDEAA